MQRNNNSYIMSATQEVFRDLYDNVFNDKNQFQTDINSDLYHLTIVPTKKYPKTDTYDNVIVDTFHEIKGILSCVIVGEVAPNGMEHYHAICRAKTGHKFVKLNTMLHKAGLHVRNKLIDNYHYEWQVFQYIFKTRDAKTNVYGKLNMVCKHDDFLNTYCVFTYSSYKVFWEKYILPLELKYSPLRLK